MLKNNLKNALTDVSSKHQDDKKENQLTQRIYLSDLLLFIRINAYNMHGFCFSRRIILILFCF